MREQGALRLTGGAGGIDHIGQLLGLHQLQSSPALLRLRRQRQVQAQQRTRQVGKASRLSRVREQQSRLAVMEHEGQALAGRVGIEQEVGAASLENRQDTADQVEATW